MNAKIARMTAARTTVAVIAALAVLSLTVPSPAQQVMAQAAPAAPAVQQAPAVTQAPAAPNPTTPQAPAVQAAPAAPTAAAPAAEATGAPAERDRLLKAAAAELREL